MLRQLGGTKVIRISTLLGVIFVLVLACLSSSPDPQPAAADTPLT
jgi:hypothetical protein